MEIIPISTNVEYDAMLDMVDKLFDKKVNPDTPEGEIIQVALEYIKQYEDLHFPITVIKDN